jgi:hypothetical protein
MRTTTRENWRFTFGVSDVGRLLGKSPVTLRQWDDKGIISFERIPGSQDRQVTAEGVRRMAGAARNHGRISAGRYHLVCATITLLEEIEGSNNRKVKR